MSRPPNARPAPNGREMHVSRMGSGAGVHHGRLPRFRGESYRVRHALMQRGVFRKHARNA